MKKVLILVMFVLVTGCASTQTTEGLQRQLIGLSTAHNEFRDSVNSNQIAVFNKLSELEYRICELEKRSGYVHRSNDSDRSKRLDQQFKKYMSK